MILSHKHKFIFIKARKTGSSAVEVNLAKHCGKDDIVTPLVLHPAMDEDKVEYSPRNCEDIHNHMPVNEIMERFPDEWRDYLKITIIRNPYDYIISLYWWCCLGAKPFKDWFWNIQFDNNMFWVGADYVMKYENLEDDYKKLCKKLDIPYDKLPKLKNRATVHRNLEFDKNMKQRVEAEFEQIIKKFYFF